MHKLAILTYPTGKAGYVGSVPTELCKKNKQGNMASIVFDTPKDAILFAQIKGYDANGNNVPA